jgi:hypothetical protein
MCDNGAREWATDRPLMPEPMTAMRRIEAQPCDGWMPWQRAREELMSIMEPAFRSLN